LLSSFANSVIIAGAEGEMTEPLAQEIDNCPKCNKTLPMQLGFAKGAYEGGFDEETEVWYANCDVCGTKFRMREAVNEKGRPAAIYDKWVCWIPQ
jgi:transcription elongation factor Elf1